MKIYIAFILICASPLCALGVIEVFRPTLVCVRYAPQLYREIIIDSGHGPEHRLVKSYSDYDADGQCVESKPVPNSSHWDHWRARPRG